MSEDLPFYDRPLPPSGIPHIKDCIAYLECRGLVEFVRYDRPWYVFRFLIKDCIAYLECRGLVEFVRYDRPWYVFRFLKRAGHHEKDSKITFTLKEARDAWKNGW